jgi:hypothetical protein
MADVKLNPVGGGASKTASDRLREFLLTRPADADPSKFDKSDWRGRQQYEAAKKKSDADQKKWDADNADVLANLKTALSNETSSGTASTKNQADLETYLKSNEHRAYEAGDVLGLIGGGYGARYINRSPAPEGAGKVNRLARTVVPALEAFAFGGKGYQQFATRPDQADDPRGYDMHNATTATFGGLAGGSAISGVDNALANLRTNSPAPSAPTAPGGSPPSNRADWQKLARDLGGGDFSNPDDAKAFVAKKVAAKGLTAAEKTALKADPQFAAAMPKANSTFAAAMKRLPMGAGIVGGAALAAMSPDEAQAGSVTGMRETGPSLNPLPSRGEQITNALGRVAGAIPEAALYSLPGGNVAALANTADALYTPSPEYLAEEKAGKFGRIGREVERSQKRDNLASAVADEQAQINALGRSQGYDWQRPRAPLDMSNVPPSMRRFADPLSSAARDPAFEAALAELIAAHGGGR